MRKFVVKAAIAAFALSGTLVGVAASPASATSRCIDRTFNVGATGNCVRDIQYMLNEINSAIGQVNRTGYAPVPPQLATDGIYGGATSFTVGHYEGWKHIAVDGIVGPSNMWGYLCNETAVSDWIHSPLLILSQAAFSAVNAGCVLHP